MPTRRSDETDVVGTATEVASALIDAATLPGVGTVFKRLAQGSREELRRARSVALKAAERTSGMTREEIADAVAQKPRLLPLATRLLHAAGENGYDETLRAMGGAFGEAVRDPEQADDCHLMLTSLADLGERHARVLRVLRGNPPVRGGKASHWMTSDVEEASSLPRRTTSLCLAALTSRGLVAASSTFFGGAMGFVITDLGRDLLSVLEAYVAESRGQ